MSATTSSTSVSSMLNQSGYLQESTTTSGLGKDDFLKLLVTQLQYQDPLNPMDDKEFVSQMAQFSSLEQLTNINDGIEKMSTVSSRQELLSAVNYIGKDVVAEGSQVSKSGESLSTITYTIESAAKAVTISIYDASGNIVQSYSQGAQNAGSYSMIWDGTNYLGGKADDGLYTVTVGAETASGESLLVDLMVSGTVTGVQTSADGTNQVVLSDGRVVNLADVKQIIEKQTASDSTSESSS